MHKIYMEPVIHQGFGYSIANVVVTEQPFGFEIKPQCLLKFAELAPAETSALLLQVVHQSAGRLIGVKLKSRHTQAERGQHVIGSLTEPAGAQKSVPLAPLFSKLCLMAASSAMRTASLVQRELESRPGSEG